MRRLPTRVFISFISLVLLTVLAPRSASAGACCTGLGAGFPNCVDVDEIDSLNIYRAGLEAMRRAVAGLSIEPEHVLVDARQIPGVDVPQEVIVKGDAKCHAIAAASILAKTERDALMARFDEEFPGYDFAAHKGYATEAHREAI